MHPPVLNRAEAEWLDDTFAAFNEASGYPAHMDAGNAQDAELPVSSFELSSPKRLYDQIADQRAGLGDSHMYRGRLVSRLINAFLYPRKMLRVLHGRPDGLRRERDIMLVDEGLAVGDVAFQQKCLNKMEGIAEAG